METIWFTDSYISKQRQTIESRLKTYDAIAAVCAFIGLGISLYENDLYFQQIAQVGIIYDSTGQPTGATYMYQTSNPESAFCSVLRAAVLILTIPVVFCVYNRYYTNLDLMKAKKSLEAHATLTSSRQLKWMILEMLYCALHCPPRVNGVINSSQQGYVINYNYDMIICLIMNGRIYLIWRYFATYSYYNNDKANRVCAENNTEGGTQFAVKAELKAKPYIIIGVCMFASIIMFGVALKMAEQPYEYVSELNWEYVWNGMWCCIILMTTVGYGDFYPRTHLGRIICVLACLWGQFLISLMVVALTFSSQFSPQEQAAYDMIKEEDYRQERKENAARAIQSSFWYMRMLSGEAAAQGSSTNLNGSSGDLFKDKRYGGNDSFNAAAAHKNEKWMTRDFDREPQPERKPFSPHELHQKFYMDLIQFHELEQSHAYERNNIPLQNLILQLNNRVHFELDKYLTVMREVYNIPERLSQLEILQDNIEGTLYVVHKSSLMCHYKYLKNRADMNIEQQMKVDHVPILKDFLAKRHAMFADLNIDDGPIASMLDSGQIPLDVFDAQKLIESQLMKEQKIKEKEFVHFDDSKHIYLFNENVKNKFKQLHVEGASNRDANHINFTSKHTDVSEKVFTDFKAETKRVEDAQRNALMQKSTTDTTHTGLHHLPNAKVLEKNSPKMIETKFLNKLLSKGVTSNTNSSRMDQPKMTPSAQQLPPVEEEHQAVVHLPPPDRTAHFNELLKMLYNTNKKEVTEKFLKGKNDIKEPTQNESRPEIRLAAPPPQAIKKSELEFSVKALVNRKIENRGDLVKKMLGLGPDAAQKPVEAPPELRLKLPNFNRKYM